MPALSLFPESLSRSDVVADGGGGESPVLFVKNSTSVVKKDNLITS